MLGSDAGDDAPVEVCVVDEDGDGGEDGESGERDDEGLEVGEAGRVVVDPRHVGEALFVAALLDVAGDRVYRSRRAGDRDHFVRAFGARLARRSHVDTLCARADRQRHVVLELLVLPPVLFVEVLLREQLREDRQDLLVFLVGDRVLSLQFAAVRGHQEGLGQLDALPSVVVAFAGLEGPEVFDLLVVAVVRELYEVREREFGVDEVLELEDVDVCVGGFDHSTVDLDVVDCAGGQSEASPPLMEGSPRFAEGLLVDRLLSLESGCVG